MTARLRLRIIELLTTHRLPLSDEKQLQAAMAEMFTAAGLAFRREVHLGPRDIVDFMVELEANPRRPDAGISDQERHSFTNPIGKADAAGEPIPRQQIPAGIGIAIEVKIKGARRAIFRQVERYCGYDAVGEVVLATNVPMSLPDEICGKPTAIAHLGRGWM